MRHQPKQLAFLISLIGAGVSPYAVARSDVRIAGVDLSAPRDAPRVATEERDAPALVRARWFAELARRTDERALTLPEPWNPLHAAPALLSRVDLADRSAVQPQGAAPSAPDIGQSASRAERLGVPAARDHDDSRFDVRAVGSGGQTDSAVVAVPAGTARRSKASPLRQLHGRQMSAHAARLRESPVAPAPEAAVAAVALRNAAARVVTDQSAGLSNADSALRPAKHRGADSVDAWFTLDSQLETTAPVSQPTAQRGERSETLVATQSGAVLRSLQAILSDERDEVGVIRPVPNDAIGATQTGRVLAALSSLSSSHAEPESPAARRARKRAAATSRAQAAVAPAASAVAAAAPDRADASVARAASLQTAPEPMPVDIDLMQPFMQPIMQPLTAEHVTAAAPIGDDEQAALAMASGPWPGIMGVDVDLSAPFTAQAPAQPPAKVTAQTTATACAVGSAMQAPQEPQAGSWPGIMGVDIDLSQPVAVEKSVPVASPGADEQAALAMKPSTWPVVEDVDIDLSLPLVAAHSTAAPWPGVAAPESDGNSRPSPFGSERVAVSDKSLDRVRGGFVTEGLNISFGIERAVYINGSLVTTTGLNLADPGRLTAGRGAPVLSSGTLGLIQSGTGNTVAPGTFSSGSIGTVIQNTLDGQKIQNVTVINATTNSLGLLKGMNLESSLRGAISDSLRR